MPAASKRRRPPVTGITTSTTRTPTAQSLGVTRRKPSASSTTAKERLNSFPLYHSDFAKISLLETIELLLAKYEKNATSSSAPTLPRESAPKMRKSRAEIKKEKMTSSSLKTTVTSGKPKAKKNEVSVNQSQTLGADM